MFLQSNYTAIERKLKNQEYDSIYDLSCDLKEFQSFFEDNGPPGPNRRTILYEFCNKALAEASDFFFRNIQNELTLQRQIGEETIKKLQTEIKEVKDEQKGRIEYFENKLRNAETEKAEISAKEQSLKENLSQVLKEREQLEVEMSEKIDQLKKESARHMEELRNKVQQAEEQSKEIHR